MLSKSQARIFFVGGTVFFVAIFVALTVDTVRQVPGLSHADRLTEQVARGKAIWDKSNCMGCHTILGEGAYYAPELTKVVARRGTAWIALFLKNPQAMFPGERKMVDYHFDDAAIADLVAFLDWIGGIDTGGFPPKPDLAPASAVAPSAAVPTPPTMFTTVCIACHSVGGKGGAVGPALDGVAHRKTAEEMDRWLRDPPAVKPGTPMPKLPMDDATRAELVAWLSSLR